MYLLRLFIILILGGFSLQSAAQKVKRKGVTPEQVPVKAKAAKYNLSQLEGRWQEIVRLPAGNAQPIAFSDSLLMKFENGKVELKDATSMRMTVKGVAAIEPPASLSVAGDIYNIRSLDKNILIVDDGEFVHQLEKKEQFYYETVGKTKLPVDSFSTPVHASIASLKGKWLVYARKASPGTIGPEIPVLRSLDVAGAVTGDSSNVMVSFYQSGESKSCPGKLLSVDGSIKISCENYNWEFYVYRVTAGELIFGDIKGLLYQARHY